MILIPASGDLRQLRHRSAPTLSRARHVVRRAVPLALGAADLTWHAGRHPRRTAADAGHALARAGDTWSTALTDRGESRLRDITGRPDVETALDLISDTAARWSRNLEDVVDEIHDRGEEVLARPIWPLHPGPGVPSDVRRDRSA